MAALIICTVRHATLSGEILSLRQCFQCLGEVLSTVAAFSPLCQNGDVLVLKAFSDKCSGIHWFKTNFLASIQVNSCHKNGCAKFDWSVPATQFHITPCFFQCSPQFTNQDFTLLKTLNVTLHKSFQFSNSQARYPNSNLKMADICKKVLLSKIPATRLFPSSQKWHHLFLNHF